MNKEQEAKNAIADILEGKELDIYTLLDAHTDNPEERIKSLSYLISLELIKQRGRDIDMNTPGEMDGILAATIHSVLDMVYSNRTKMGHLLIAVLDGIGKEERVENKIKHFPKKSDMEKWR